VDQLAALLADVDSALPQPTPDLLEHGLVGQLADGATFAMPEQRRMVLLQSIAAVAAASRLLDGHQHFRPTSPAAVCT
jgi:hypothetical protein